MYTQNKILLVFLAMTALMTSITSTTINYAIAQQQQQPAGSTTEESIIIRDSVTVLLEGKSVKSVDIDIDMDIAL